MMLGQCIPAIAMLCRSIVDVRHPTSPRDYITVKVLCHVDNENDSCVQAMPKMCAAELVSDV